MRPTTWVAVLLFGIAMCWSPQRLAPRAGSIPDFAIPDRLKSYTAEQDVLENARAVLDLLKKAEVVRNGGGLETDCQTEDVESLYRGMHFVHLAYYLFISKQEVGWFEDVSPTQTDPPRAFVDFGRSVLMRLWAPKDLARALDLVTKFDEFPLEIRADVARYLTKLRDFRAYHRDVLRARGELDALYARLYHDKTARYWRLYVSEERIKEVFPDKTPMNFDAELRELINKVRSADQPALDACLEAGAPHTIIVSEERKIKSNKFLLPISYMLRFWDRREAEGTSALAEFLLAKAISRISP